MISQSTVVLLIAVLFGIACAAAVANAADEGKSQLRRTIGFALVIALMGTMAAVILIVGLRFNFTSSVPPGVYHLVAVSPEALHRGMSVAVCAPPDAVDLGRHRGYLSAGSCFGESEPLLKTVGAVAGDTVTATAEGVRVNGRLLSNSQSLSFDSAGRRLTPWHSGRHRIPAGSIWLYADDERSWDSRYFGPTPVRNVVGVVAPVVVGRIPSVDFAPGFRPLGGPGLRCDAPHLPRILARLECVGELGSL